MRPLLDTLFVSREKLAFIVDATAAPIASISPISSWVGFEVGLIQTELDALVERGSDLGDIKESGLAVFFQSIKYRYYPIFMIVLMVALIVTKRDFGPMLLAERKTHVYKRTDGGDGKGRNNFGVSETANKPESGTPLISLNMILPILLLVRTRATLDTPNVSMDVIHLLDLFHVLHFGANWERWFRGSILFANDRRFGLLYCIIMGYDGGGHLHDYHVHGSNCRKWKVDVSISCHREGGILFRTDRRRR